MPPKQLKQSFFSNNHLLRQSRMVFCRPAFIGYKKHMDGVWNWFNDTYSYTNTYTDTGGVHMAIIDGTGDWEVTSIDAKGHLYDLLCSLGRI